jgi:hypothetical protein
MNGELHATLNLGKSIKLRFRIQVLGRSVKKQYETTLFFLAAKHTAFNGAFFKTTYVSGKMLDHDKQGLRYPECGADMKHLTSIWVTRTDRPNRRNCPVAVSWGYGSTKDRTQVFAG